jgi:hypothetical protein
LCHSKNPLLVSDSVLNPYPGTIIMCKNIEVSLIAISIHLFKNV